MQTDVLSASEGKEVSICILGNEERETARRLYILLYCEGEKPSSKAMIGNLKIEGAEERNWKGNMSPR
jgi:hypothetical protein